MSEDPLSGLEIDQMDVAVVVVVVAHITGAVSLRHSTRWSLVRVACLSVADLVVSLSFSAKLLPGATCWHDPRGRPVSQKVPAPRRRSLHPHQHLQRLQTKPERTM